MADTALSEKLIQRFNVFFDLFSERYISFH